ncbi:hypothetical protein D5282_05755 [bacterium 1xD8-48]|nr:hypothetical protein [bacterium 1xD8-48]
MQRRHQDKKDWKNNVMNILSYYIKKIRNMSFQEFFYSIHYVYVLPLKSEMLKKFYKNKTTFSKKISKYNPTSVFLPDSPFEGIKTVDISALLSVCENYCKHYFDLLGSGWVYNGFKNDALGLFDHRYQGLELDRGDDGLWLEKVLTRADAKVAREIYKHISPEYQPIDWQKDFKTGYRWSAKEWYRPIQYINADITPGVDIKVPWELSRLQHLTRMAVLYGNAVVTNHKRQELAKEYQNQCLDFIAQNPPMRGVNWYCTMDVGIRLANLSLSYMIFKSEGCEFSGFFEKVFLTSVEQHCKFIRKNLEWSPTCRSNHYLSDVCGLLFGASILPEGVKRKKWITFAIGQIRKELLLQFHEDGSNFEASVAYHRLSSELIIYSIALILGLMDKVEINPITAREKDLLEKIGLFIKDMVLPDGTIYQCGDNDSGRFVNLTPIGNITCIEKIREKYVTLTAYNGPIKENQPIWKYFDENVNRPDGMLAAWAELLGIRNSWEKNCKAEVLLVRALMNGNSLKEQKDDVKTYSNKDEQYGEDVGKNINEARLDKYVSALTIQFSRPLSYMPSYQEYTDFGVSILRSDEVFLGVCWTDNGQNGNAGHTHNDKLSFELWVHGQPLFRDPGTFVYTPFPDMRNAFRSVKGHNCLQAEREQNIYNSLFSMKNDSRCRIIKKVFNQDNVCLIYEVEFGNVLQQRKFSIDRNKLRIEDKSSVPFTVDLTQYLMTEGYGKLTKYNMTKAKG